MRTWMYRSVALLILTVTLGETPGHAEILAQNPWNNLTQAGWFSTGTLAIVPTAGAPDAPNALRYRHPAGFVGGRSTANSGYTLESLSITEVYVGAWVKYSANWFWGTGNKLFYTFWCTTDDCTFRHGIATSVWGNSRIFNTTANFVSGSRALYANTGYNPTIQVNRWYWIEHRVKLNTVVGGVPRLNGIYELWLNDQKVMSYANLDYTNLDTPKLKNADQYASWASSPQTKPAEDYLYYDLTTISTTRIGLPGSSPGDTPPPPASLTVR